MSKRNKNRIPQFDEGRLFVYFNSLADDSKHPPGIGRVTKALYNRANNYLSTSAFQPLSSSTSETITNALSFLGKVADNERGKEISLIENYINDIQNSIPPKLKQSRNLQQIISDLKSTSKTLSVGNNTDPAALQGVLDNFYTELTTYINLVRQSVDEFQDRIHDLMDDTMETRKQLADRSFLYRIDSEIDSALLEFAGAAGKKTADSFSSMLSETIFDKFFLDTGAINNIDIQANFAAILSGMIIDFEHFLQQDKALNNIDSITKYNRTDIESLFESYLNTSNTYFSQEIRRITQFDSISKGFQMTLDNFSSRIGLSNVFSEKQKAALDKRRAALEKAQKTLNSPPRKGQRNYIAKKLMQLNLGDLVVSNNFIHITAKTDQRHGTLYEAIEPILYGAFTTQGHPATDTIGIGSIYASINEVGIANVVQEKIMGMAQSIQKTGRSERKDRFANYSKELQGYNDELRKTSDELNELLTPLLKLNQQDKQLFIYHESLKLYSSMEQTSSGEALQRKASEFEGRELNALNALDILYSMDDGSHTMDLLDRTALSEAVLNLATQTVGGGQKGNIANYLSIFAGMMMFSDITNMATEISQLAVDSIQSNNDAHHIHLYSLNGTYVPGSMILSYVYNAMSKIGSTIDLNSFVKVSISTSGAEREIEKYEKERENGLRKYDEDDWDEMAEKVQKGTKIQIAFLGTFLQLINSINNIL